MNLTPRINEAIKLSSRLHREQVRKDYGKTPYISHLMSVAILVSSVTEDEDAIIAGLMHDSLEDIPDYTFEKLANDCGIRVAEIVRHVSEPLDANKSENEQLPWLRRKEIYIENLRKGGIESALVSAGDKIHNTESLIIDIQKEGDEFIKRFGSSLLNKLWFHEQVLSILEEKLGALHPLVVRLKSALTEYKILVEDRIKNN
jgi:(p)ppGpp synthase/HD superfamily hydrolase